MPEDTQTKYSMDHLPHLMTFRLSRLQARANAQAAKILKKNAAISLSEWRIFVMIDSSGPITPAQIVRTTNSDKGLISRTIKGMDQKGLIAVKLSESDQRSHVIDFTKKGFAVFEKAKPAMRNRQEILSQSMSESEMEQLFAAFDKLEIAFDKLETEL